MLLQLYPRVHRRYSSLPVFGPIVEDFGAWLLKQGYSTDCIREHFCCMLRTARLLYKRGVGSLAELTRAKLQACAPAQRLDDRRLTASVRLLERYFASETSLFSAPLLNRTDKRVAEYATYLDEVRGLAESTVAGHCATAAALLTHIGYELTPERLRALTPQDIEAFVRHSGARLNRSSLQSMVAHVRTFLRFVASSGEAPTGLDRQIDTPRVYREEKLPKSLPWETVQAFLRGIDRTTPSGIRDYAIFLLIATYGLRGCDIVALTLDDVAWRARRLRIQQRKTGRLLWLPLSQRKLAWRCLDCLHVVEMTFDGKTECYVQSGPCKQRTLAIYSFHSAECGPAICRGHTFSRMDSNNKREPVWRTSAVFISSRFRTCRRSVTGSRTTFFHAWKKNFVKVPDFSLRSI